MAYERTPHEVVEFDEFTSIFITRKNTECLRQGEFSNEFPPEFVDVLQEDDFKRSIEEINDVLGGLPSLWIIYGPCIPCCIFGVILIMITLSSITVETAARWYIIGICGVTCVLTILGFIYFFINENRLDQVVLKQNREGQKVIWRRGISHRHDQIEIRISKLPTEENNSKEKVEDEIELEFEKVLHVVGTEI
jgi:hypothetical protein